MKPTTTIVLTSVSRYHYFMADQLTETTSRARRRSANNDDPPEYAILDLHDWGELGDTLARFEDGVIRVFGGIPGERVKARIIRYRRRRRQHISAITEEVIKPSPHRIAPPCPYFGNCTGCQWQHIRYSHQLELKRDRVANALAEYPELRAIPVAPTIPSPQTFGYRNHARFTVRNSGMLGFINRLTRRFVKVEDCALMHPWINKALRTLQDKAAETTQLSVRYGFNTGDWLI